MSKHITEWLNAYVDGELHGTRLQQVEAHLAECEVCLAELESLERLSDLLLEVPAPEFTSAERFASQVNLRLPHEQKTLYRKKLLEVGWWMVPVGLIAVWVFMSTSFLMNNILSAANNAGLLASLSDRVIFGPADWSAALGQLGVLSGDNLHWAISTEAFTRTSILQISFEVSIALLYLSWIAIWWARHRRHARQPHGQLLEG
jgi:predicted anti-sigma-YlaC factor YlaD